MSEGQLPHELELKERRELTMTGVTEVVSFEEHAVVLRTALGTLIVQGRELQLKTLSLEGGQVAVEGLTVGGKGLELEQHLALFLKEMAFGAEDGFVGGAAEDQLFQGLVSDGVGQHPTQGIDRFQRRAPFGWFPTL